ncbi:hypothetical protein ABZ635_11790 [Nocardiopsis sp. NPDC007018]|uniref:hypothetical protein n=1 Tax=Nocardiopsis sp. NPDC007018 TaxID=3155721 RepID=UPI0033EE3A21
MNARTEERARARRQRLLDQFEDPVTRALWADRGARVRRTYLSIALALASTAALTSLALSQSALAVTASSLAVVVLLIAQTGAFHRIEAGSRTLHGYAEVVDERQRAEIDAARDLGHSVTSALLILVVAGAGAAQLAGTNPWTDLTVPIGLLLPVVWLVLVVHRSFPACYLAWTQPDEPLDDESTA